MNDPQDPHSSGMAYEFEVKEQDRWLPIANGKSSYFPSCLPSPGHDSWCACVNGPDRRVVVFCH